MDSALYAKCTQFIRENRPALVKKAEEVLKTIHGQPGKAGGVVYNLFDQARIDEVWEGSGLSEDEVFSIGENDLNAVGDLDVWIEAARNLGFTNYVESLEDVKENGL